MSRLTEFELLLGELFDSDAGASDETKARLEELLNASEEARRTYFEYINIHLAVVDHAEVETHTKAVLDEPQPTKPTIVHHPSKAESDRRSRWLNYLPVAAVCLLLGLALPRFLDRPGDNTAQMGSDLLAKRSTSERAEPAIPDFGVAATAKRYVAEISNESADIEWGAGSSDREFLLRLRSGDRLELNRGLLQVDYFSGASLILRGPCAFSITGEASGRLESGELTGQVDIGEFALTTPSAKVIDLGTAFGVSVDSSANTDVCVFDGKVSLTAEDEAGNFSEPILLTVGMSARATRQGNISSDVAIDGGAFARTIPLPPSVEMTGNLSLVDVVNGYEQNTYRLAAGIAPDTGQAYQQEWLAANEAYPRSRKGTYHVTNWHPLVDGVFIPEANGRSVQVDSNGRRVPLVENDARTSGPIWSRRRISDPSRIVFHENFWGGATLERVLDRLSACEWGMIGLHANVGITIDLDAVRSMHDVYPTKFQAVIANLDNSREFRPDDASGRKLEADFRLYLDGKLKRSRLGFGRSDGDLFISIPIRDSQRFLTIITTDAGHYWYDQVVLIDPILTFSEPQ